MEGERVFLTESYAKDELEDCRLIGFFCKVLSLLLVAVGDQFLVKSGGSCFLGEDMSG